jgi:hypothetical protein
MTCAHCFVVIVQYHNQSRNGSIANTAGFNRCSFGVTWFGRRNSYNCNWLHWLSTLVQSIEAIVFLFLLPTSTDIDSVYIIVIIITIIDAGFLVGCRTAQGGALPYLF